MKTLVFMLFCLFLFSAMAGKDSNKDSFNESLVRSESHHRGMQAILTPATEIVIEVHSLILRENKNQFSNIYKTDSDSRLYHQRLITLQRNRVTIIPLQTQRYYLSVVPSNKDDLPDLS